MKKRLFLAIMASSALQQQVADWRAKNNFPVRWIPPENLHLTLIPPWYAEEREISEQKRLVGLTEPFTLRFDRVTFGPDPRGPRLIWVSGPTPLHLTIARFKPEDFRSFPIKELNDPINWQEQVTSYSLLESKLTPQGAVYTVLQNYELN